MAKFKIIYRTRSEGIDKDKNTAKEFMTFGALFLWLVQRFAVNGCPVFGLTDLYLTLSGKSGRRFAVCTSRFLTNNYCRRYGAPQVIGYAEVKEV